MNYFKETYHLSEILENSQKEPVIIFKFSSECASSSRLKEELQKNIENENISYDIYLITVQLQKVLSKKIEEYFNVKHESPQIILIKHGNVLYYNSHHHIKIEEFMLK